VPSLNLKPNPCGRTAKKITSSPYKKFVEATQKNKIKQGTKSKTNWLVLNAFLGPTKRQKRRVCQDPSPSDTPSDSDNDPTVLSLTIWHKKRYVTLTVCSALVIFLKTTM
jgi:hypothetical protein